MRSPEKPLAGPNPYKNPKYTGSASCVYRTYLQKMVQTEPGLRAEIKVGSPSDCPIAGVSEESGVQSRSISRTDSGSSPLVTEEAVFESDEVDIEGISGDETRMKEVFAYDSKSVYRFSRERGRGCACECVEDFGYPVVDTQTRDGDLFLTFHVPDTEALKRVMSRLGERYPEVEVRRLIRSKTDDDGSRDLVLVDRSQLTKKQEEALRTAHEMGYFEHPKGANAGEVADELGISTSTFTEHLAVAQGKLMRSILDG